MSSSLKLEPFADIVLALGIACVHKSVSLRRRGGIIYVYLSFLTL